MNQNHVSARIRRGVGAAIAALAIGGCGSGSASISGNVEDPSMYVDTASTLAGRLNGSFSLYVSLPVSAKEGTDVSIGLGNFTLVDSSQKAITVLKLRAEPEPPYHLEPGKSFQVRFTINDKGPGQILTKDEQTALCKSSEHAISGSISDDDGDAPVSSPKFTIRCP